MKIVIHQKDIKEGKKLYLLVRHNTEKAYIDTGISTLYPIIKTNGAGLGIALDRREKAMKPKIKRLEHLYWEVDEYIVSHPNVRPKDVKNAFSKNNKDKGELVQTIQAYADSGRVGGSAAAIIRRTAAKVEEFDADAGYNIDEDWLDRFSAWLKEQGAKINGIGLHLRNIRTVFNYARKKKLTKEYPFLDYKIKVEKIPIRNMSIEQIREFKDYPCEAWQVEYRDMFMLMVYLAGINIGDLLLNKGLDNGRIVYKRRKTDRPLNIFVCNQAKEIINKYKGEKYLLSPMDRYSDYHGYAHKMNDGLKKIGKVEIVKDKAGKLRKKQITPLFEGLSTYVARYTFASLAAEIGVERDIIAACLGHSWSDVTGHYIAYTQKKMDEAIRKVAEYINEK